MARLSNFLSKPSGSSMIRPPGGQHPVIRRSNPYASQNFRASRPITPEAPFAGQDLASALLQQQQFTKSSVPATDYQDTYNYDPILQKIRALGTQSVANARTNAGALRNEAAITEGDPDLLRSLGFDTNTVTAAQNNPESLFSQLNTSYTKKSRDLADAMQAQNLYYSGEYQRNLGELAKGQASGQGQLGQHFRDLLSGIDSGVLDATESDRKAQEQAAQDAAMQASYSNQYQSLLDQLNALQNPPAAAPGPAPGASDPLGNYIPGASDYASGAQTDPFVNLGNLPQFSNPVSTPTISPSAPVNVHPLLQGGNIPQPGIAYIPQADASQSLAPTLLQALASPAPVPALAPAAIPSQPLPPDELLAALANPQKAKNRSVFA